MSDLKHALRKLRLPALWLGTILALAATFLAVNQFLYSAWLHAYYRQGLLAERAAIWAKWALAASVGLFVLFIAFVAILWRTYHARRQHETSRQRSERR
jgi:hypothetical protein